VLATLFAHAAQKSVGEKLSWPLLIPLPHFFADKFVIFAIATCDCCEFAINLAK